MRCKAITKMKWLDKKNHQCSHRAVSGEFCAKHSTINKHEALQKAFDICFHALKTIEERMTDPQDEAYLIARQALVYFESPTMRKLHDKEIAAIKISQPSCVIYNEPI